MSPRSSLALLAALLLLPHAVRGQDTGLGGVLSVDDATGDVQTTIEGQPAGNGQTLYPACDLVGLKVTETQFSIQFALLLAALPSQNDPGVDGLTYTISFLHHAREFRVSVQAGGGFVFSFGQAFVQVQSRDPGTDWSDLYFGSDVAADPTAKSLTVDLPRDLFADADGAAPYPGRALESVQALAESNLSDRNATIFLVPTKTPQKVYDRVPDDGAPLPSLVMQLGTSQTGHARLSSDRPYRASNGEATTFVYNVTAHNLGKDNDTFEITASNAPAGYTLVLPVPVVRLAPGEAKTVPVLLTMPFGHQHGSLATVLIEMKSLSDPGSVGRLQIGVRFLAVPQPAGHHDAVFLHHTKSQSNLPETPGNLFEFTPGYINTLEDDPNDSGAKFPGTGFSGNEDGTFVFSWTFPLQPTLEMGLIVDPAKVGHFTIPLGSTLPLLKTTVNVTVFAGSGPFAFFGDRPITVGTGQTAPVDVQPNTSQLFEADLLPPRGGGRIAPDPSLNLYLEVTVHSQTPDPTLGIAGAGPYIAPGGSAHLPLSEWHDDVDETLAALSGPAFTSLGDQEKLVNPGKGVGFPFSIANPTNAPAKVLFETTGPNAAWSAVVPESLTVPAHGTAQGTLQVRVPANAVDGERADLVLQAYVKGNPTDRGLIRIVAEVDTDAQHPDELAVAAVAKKKSPDAGVAFASLALAAALLAVARRRR